MAATEYEGSSLLAFGQDIEGEQASKTSPAPQARTALGVGCGRVPTYVRRSKTDLPKF
jgi:hypothetical protein